MGTIWFGLAFQITYVCASKETWAFAASAPGRPKDPRVGRKFRSPTATLNDVRDESSIQVSSGGPGWLRLPYSYSRFHLFIPSIVQRPHFLQATALCKFATGKLERKEGRGERRVKKGFEKREKEQAGTGTEEGSQVWQGGGIAGEHM